MGAVGALVLAVIRHPKLGWFGTQMFHAGLIAFGVGVAIGFFAFKSVPFKLAFAVMYLSIAYLVYRSWQIRELHDLIVQAFKATMRLTAMVSFILIGSTAFSIVFQGNDG